MEPLLIQLDQRARGKLQEQICAQVRRAILDGALRPGTRMPSSRALATELGVSRNTTLLAFEQLLAEGYLTTRHGAGTFVTAMLPDGVLEAHPARPSRTKHPPLSRRGITLASTPRPAWRVKGAPTAFRIGTPALDLFPTQLWSQLANRRLRSLTAKQLDYGDFAGMRALREAIAEHVSTARGTTCAADQIIVVSGAQRGLDVVSRALLDPGDRVWMEEPGYPGAWGALQAAGARIAPVRVDQDGLDVESGARRRHAPRLIYVTPSHQFPLGVPMSLPRRLALLRFASASQAWVVEDDYDSEFRYSARPIPCLHGLDSDGRVIYVGSFSKTIFPSLRLGFLIVPRDLFDHLRSARWVADYHPPLLDQAVLADFMDGGHFHRHLRRMRMEYRERLDALTAACDRYCGGALRIRPVQTGLHAVADLVGSSADRVSEEAAAREIEAMALSRYYLRRASVPNCLVLGFAAVRPDVIVLGMQRLAEAIEAARE